MSSKYTRTAAWIRTSFCSRLNIPPCVHTSHLACLLIYWWTPGLLTGLQFSSDAQSCPTRCDPVDCSTPGLPVHHQLQELAQTHVHQVGDAILPSHPLSSPSPAFNLSQHQGLFRWVSSLHQVAKVLSHHICGYLLFFFLIAATGNQYTKLSFFF